MRKSLAFLVLLFLAVFSVASAFATELDNLGQGLGFLRLGPLADQQKSFNSPVGDTPALVLDLRDATADETVSTALLATLRGRPAGRGVCLVLLSSSTAPALLAAFATTPSGCLTVGRADGACHPDIAVATTADAEQRVRAAFAAGMSLTALLSVPSDKPRHDEAELAKDHAAGIPPPAEDDSAAPSAPKPIADETTKKSAPPKEPPVLDVVLQRAVQVHRGLLALGKIK